MSYLSIEGGAPLHGELTIQGSKNSVLPVLAATILARDVCRIENCPRLRDVDASVAILRHLGCCVRRDGTALEVDTAPMARCDIPDELMREMRSSIIFLGAILARQGEAKRCQAIRGMSGRGDQAEAPGADAAGQEDRLRRPDRWRRRARLQQHARDHPGPRGARPGADRP